MNSVLFGHSAGRHDMRALLCEKDTAGLLFVRAARVAQRGTTRRPLVRRMLLGRRCLVANRFFAVDQLEDIISAAAHQRHGRCRTWVVQLNSPTIFLLPQLLVIYIHTLGQYLLWLGYLASFRREQGPIRIDLHLELLLAS